METQESVPVHVNIQKGKTVCICHANAKGCGRPCPKDTVKRDEFCRWEKTMNRNQYGK